ncbi:UDP-N-acetylglucosamine 2-epimerase (hydrolyzing), partial [Enterobacter hormaechei]|nr:UDP-N-acetylglucosamine 2-epimerase (hydrolyzing) [Enterobacter hormaechei]
MKRIVYISGSRAEYGIMKRLLLELKKNENIELKIIATGMHCDPKYGMTYKYIENDGFDIIEKIDIKLNTESNYNVIQSMSLCQNEIGKHFETYHYDAVIVLGDRFEIFAASTAAAMNNIPIIHLHGGEQTLGNYDEFIRHAITKMSRLHLVSTEEYRKRVIQLGESPETVYNIGALGAENSLSRSLPNKESLEKKYGQLMKPYFMVVFHPETITKSSPHEQAKELLAALEVKNNHFDYIFIGSNSDTGSDFITNLIKNYCERHRCRFITSVQSEDYLALNKYSQGLIGNSSSGLIEIPSLGVPTINIGDRQKGRVRGESVIDVKCNREEIVSAIMYSQSEHFKSVLKNAVNPYYKKDCLKLAQDSI